MKPTPEGSAILRRVIKRIEAEPRRFDMDTWGHKIARDDGPACGTTACIAGWIALDRYTIPHIKKMGPSRIEGLVGDALNPKAARKAGRLMGLSVWPRRLFLDYEWPEQFRLPYQYARTPAARVKVAVARIRHFIEEVCLLAPGCDGKIVWSLRRLGHNFPVCQRHYADAMRDGRVIQKAVALP